ncbi:alpha/beta fold hydrolase [Halodurantibacterium flavum]|uniref:Alpha/beta fold hydrolase n=1 Tax=Halodurantibacterium flavum TaxID=1382802 RepID=A0ABW4S855_9RHOB
MLPELATCPIPAEITISAPEPNLAELALDTILAPFQPLREQFTAITGLGLEADLPENVGLRRIFRPAEGGTLSYLAVGSPAGQRILFLHGSPGLAEEWAHFLVDVPGQYRIAVDRPGFGDSRTEVPVTALDAQAGAVAPLLGPPGTAPAVLVGYSYGGPVALRLAADHPDRVAAVLLIGSAADPGLEETHPLQLLAAQEFFSGLLPDELAHANAELLDLPDGLQDLGEALAGITAPVTMVQGLSDSLVPPENVSYLRARLPPDLPQRVILVEGADHFLPWTSTSLLEDALGCALGDAGWVRR